MWMIFLYAFGTHQPLLPQQPQYRYPTEERCLDDARAVEIPGVSYAVCLRVP